HLEVLALRHQLQVLQRSRPRRLRLATIDRWLWAWLARSWSGWRTAVVIVKSETVIAWHRKGFRLFWTWKSRRGGGRPVVPPDGSFGRWRATTRSGEGHEFMASS